MTIKSSIDFLRIHILLANARTDDAADDTDGGGGEGGDGGDGGEGECEGECDGECEGDGEDDRAGASESISRTSLRVSVSTISVISFHFKYSIHAFRYS